MDKDQEASPSQARAIRQNRNHDRGSAKSPSPSSTRRNQDTRHHRGRSTSRSRSPTSTHHRRHRGSTRSRSPPSTGHKRDRASSRTRASSPSNRTEPELNPQSSGNARRSTGKGSRRPRVRGYGLDRTTYESGNRDSSPEDCDGTFTIDPTVETVKVRVRSDMIDEVTKVLAEGKKRKYNKTSWSDVFDMGHMVGARLMVNARCTFFMYLDVPEDRWGTLIDIAAKEKIDPFSPEYALGCKRLQEWRKNWWKRTMDAAKRLQMDLMTEHNWQSLPQDALMDVSSDPQKSAQFESALLTVALGVPQSYESTLH
jgi:hypothetical protein